MIQEFSGVYKQFIMPTKVLSEIALIICSAFSFSWRSSLGKVFGSGILTGAFAQEMMESFPTAGQHASQASQATSSALWTNSPDDYEVFRRAQPNMSQSGKVSNFQDGVKHTCEFDTVKMIGNTLPAVLSYDPSLGEETVIQLPTFGWGYDDTYQICGPLSPEFNFECEDCSGLKFYVQKSELLITFESSAHGQSFKITMHAVWPSGVEALRQDMTIMVGSTLDEIRDASPTPVVRHDKKEHRLLYGTCSGYSFDELEGDTAFSCLIGETCIFYPTLTSVTCPSSSLSIQNFYFYCGVVGCTATSSFVSDPPSITVSCTGSDCLTTNQEVLMDVKYNGAHDGTIRYWYIGWTASVCDSTTIVTTEVADIPTPSFDACVSTTVTLPTPITVQDQADSQVCPAASGFYYSVESVDPLEFFTVTPTNQSFDVNLECLIIDCLGTSTHIVTVGYYDSDDVQIDAESYEVTSTVSHTPTPVNEWKLTDSNGDSSLALTHDVRPGTPTSYTLDTFSDCLGNSNAFFFQVCDNTADSCLQDYDGFNIDITHQTLDITSNDLTLNGSTYTIQQWMIFYDETEQTPYFGTDFTVEFFDSCDSTVIFASELSDVYLDISGTTVSNSFAAFTDSLSNSFGITEYCGAWTYDWSYAAALGTANGVTRTEVSATEWELQWSSGSVTDYTLDQAYVTSVNGMIDGKLRASANFNVFFTDRCASAEYIVPTLDDVFLDYRGSPQTLSFYDFTDSISESLGVEESCGVWTYEWSYTTLGSASGITKNEVSATNWDFEWNSGLASTYNLNQAYYTTVNGLLDGSVVTSTNFKIYFQCEVTSVAVSSSMVSQANYTLSDEPATFTFASYKLTPACVNQKTFTYTVDGDLSIPSWITISDADQIFVVSTTDYQFVGNHTIEIISSYLDLDYKDSQISIITIVDPTVTETEASYEETLSTLSSIDNDDFDWGGAFAQAIMNRIQNKNSIKHQIVAPVPVLDKVAKEGLVEIRFSQPMIVPPLDVIKNSTVNINGVTLPALQLVVIPGYYSAPENLTFNYNITSYTSQNLTLVIDFDHPLLVSSQDDPDQLEVRFNGHEFFFSEDGMTIEPQTVLKRRLPRMVDKSGLTARFAAASETVGAVTNGVLISNLALNIILSASLNQLWSMINTQQIIVLMALFNIKLPPNAAVFFRMIMRIAAFDILPTDTFYDEYMDIHDSEPINDAFEEVGFESLYFLYNLGSLIVAIVTFPIGVLMLVLFRPCKACSDRTHRWYMQLKYKIFWNLPITVFSESYSILVMCCLINISNQNYETKGNQLTTVLALGFTLMCVALPLIFAAVIYRKFNHLMRPRTKKRFGALYENLDLSRGRRVIYQIVHFFVRRLMLALVIVTVDHLLLQIYTITTSFLIQIYILGFVRPFDSQTQKMEYFNEIVINLTLYCMMCFTDFLPSVDSQFQMGWVCIGLVCSHLGLNLFFLVKDSLTRTGWYCKRLRLRQKQKREKKLKIQQLEESKDEIVDYIVEDDQAEALRQKQLAKSWLMPVPEEPEQTSPLHSVSSLLVNSEQVINTNIQKFKASQLDDRTLDDQLSDRLTRLTDEQYLQKSQAFRHSHDPQNQIRISNVQDSDNKVSDFQNYTVNNLTLDQNQLANDLTFADQRRQNYNDQSYRVRSYAYNDSQIDIPFKNHDVDHWR